MPNIPFGLPDEPTPAGGGSGAGRAFSVQNYGWMYWKDLFSQRQLLALGMFISKTRNAHIKITENNYSQEWEEAVGAYLGTIFSRTLDYMAILCVWEKGAEEVKHVFMRWALPITWDYAEANPLAPIERFYAGGFNSAQMVLSRFFNTSWENTCHPNVLNQSALTEIEEKVDILFTDPPYYDAIPYSDLMDFFYIWLKRSISGLSPEIDTVIQQKLAPKWDAEKQDGELIDDESRHGGSAEASKKAYEEGMYRAFVAGYNKLASDGRMVVVFANKNPFAWETLVASIIRAGFCVTGSWPIASEMPGGLRNLNRASLASSIWLVCKKRPESARPGWDNRVLEEMRANITERLRQFWDAGIRGPDFVWAATGPALEAYSQYPVVKKANEPGELLTVGKFLTHVRRMVVDFVVGRVLTSITPDFASTKNESSENVDVSSLDAITTYYLLHRNDFAMEDAPAGPCILYAVSCGLSDGDLADRFDLLARRGGKSAEEDEEETEGEEGESQSEGTGSAFRLKAWNQRRRPNMGFEPGEEQTLERLPLFPDMPAEHESSGGYVIPLIDQVHRLMHLWRAGDVTRVDDYLERRASRRNQLFHQLLQALIELSPTGSEERSLLESISNHVGAGGNQGFERNLL